jgi:protein TonB
MSARTSFIVGSFAVHVALAIGLGHVHAKESHAATAIELASIPKAKKAPPEPTKVDPVVQKPAPARAASHHVAAPPPAENTPPPPAAAAHAAADALPDFGLSLSGGVGGDGIAIPVGGGAAAGPVAAHAAPVHRALSAAPSSTQKDECDDPIVKPKPISVPQPAYTASARAASIEGKVRVRLTVDETGKVVDVSVLQGLGYGLDEAALEAARAATFEPATHCGKAVRATFNISMRFSAS